MVSKNLIKEYNELISKYGKNKYNYLGNFLDCYYRSGKNRNSIFKNEPNFGKMSKKYKSYLISSFIYLCDKDCVNTPKWMLNKKYILKEPFFAIENCGDNMKGYLVANSPSCYRMYNIFTDREPLRKC